MLSRTGYTGELGFEIYCHPKDGLKELSNVDLGKEFQTMILVQQAYNSAASVFKTVDEMTTVATDLKR